MTSKRPSSKPPSEHSKPQFAKPKSLPPEPFHWTKKYAVSQYRIHFTQNRTDPDRVSGWPVYLDSLHEKSLITFEQKEKWKSPNPWKPYTPQINSPLTTNPEAQMLPEPIEPETPSTYASRDEYNDSTANPITE